MELLSVDWDAFFPTPSPYSADDLGFFDWGCQENPMFFEPIWLVRAGAFWRADRPLPQPDPSYKTFWETVELEEGAWLYYGESHAWLLEVPDVTYDVKRITNLDAHHDCGYHEKDTGKLTCGNWGEMWTRWGGKLRVFYPPWMPDWAEREPSMPLAGAVPRGLTPPLKGGRKLGKFGRVFLCRSGAWVPSWCDDAWEEFLALCPIPEERRKNLGLYPRQWDEEAARAMMREQDAAFAAFRARQEQGKEGAPCQG